MKNNGDFQGPNAAALPAGGGGLLGRTAAPASTLSRPAGVPALKLGAAAAGTGSQLSGEQVMRRVPAASPSSLTLSVRWLSKLP
jgi:hypothetical protein